MPKLTYNCPLCDKPLKLKEEISLGETKFYSYTCGHVFARDITIVDASKLDFTSADGSGKHARHYQEAGVKFILESDFNCIIGDQMRLGKTPQALLALKNAYKERTPCLILVRSANLWQWIREYKVWCDTLPNGIFPVIGSKAWIPPGFSAYILSMDTFSRPRVLEALKKIPFKLIIADEAHSFKNTESNRSQALTDFVKFLNEGEEATVLHFNCNRCDHKWFETGSRKFDKRIGHTVISKSTTCPECGNYCYVQQQHASSEKWTKNPEAAEKVTKLLALGSDKSTTQHERDRANEKAQELKDQYNLVDSKDDKPCGLILLTGTPILNRADEYFVPLNLVNPEKFSSLDRFRKQWLEQDTKDGKLINKWSRVKRYYLDAFKEQVKDYLLRREKEDVYTDLPELNKIYTIIEPDKSLYVDAYNDTLSDMEVKMADKPNISFYDLSDDMMKLRRLCGMMKLPWTADYLEACALESSSKYAIGIHHESVREGLYTKLGMELNCFKLSGQDDADKKDWIMRNWATSSRQFLIINMLAGGVGMDFHYCDNVLVLERQWNSETESQFEFRFYNPDLSIKKNPTNVEYIIAKGTLDEWWWEMVEEKRKAVGETVYNHWNIENDASTFRELVERTIGTRLTK